LVLHYDCEVANEQRCRCYQLNDDEIHVCSCDVLGARSVRIGNDGSMTCFTFSNDIFLQTVSLNRDAVCSVATRRLKSAARVEAVGEEIGERV
jgi:hypothetical protein